MSTPLFTPEAPFSTSNQVMFYDTDCGGVVHNLAYLRWVEECRTKLATAVDIDYAAMANDGLFTVIVRHEVDYHFPAVLGDEVRCEGYIESVEKSSLWFHFEVLRATDGKKLITVRQRLALVKMPLGRPCRIPTDWQAKAAPQP